MSWINEEGTQVANKTVQILVFGCVGVASNAALYTLYLVLSKYGVPILAAMTATFALGVMLSWALNGVITFRTRLTKRSSLRMFLVYMFAYLANFTLLWLAVQVLALPHQWVQLVIMLTLALALFFFQKFWVFSRH